MRVVGYSDRWSVGRGETVRFYVSCSGERYSARLVRLIHGDQNPRGPGFKAIPVAAPVNGDYAGSQQAIHTGSYVRVDACADRIGPAAFTVLAWVKPTAVRAGEQGLVTQWAPADRAGFGLFIGEATGTIEARMSLEDGSMVTLLSERPLRSVDWYFVALSYDPARMSLELRTDTHRNVPLDAPREILSARLPAPLARAVGRPLLIGAGSLAETEGRRHATGCFNGKLSAPGILARALSAAEIQDAGAEELAAVSRNEWLARWDLAQSPSRRIVTDASGHGHEGVAVNRPTRAVTGHNWRARTNAFWEEPAQYNAAHFHDDDLEDAGWKESFRFVIPAELRSGVYAIELTTPHGDADCVPFFVRPATGKPEAAVAVLMPTVSYMAYSNEAVNIEPFEFLAPLCPLRNMGLQPVEYAYIESVPMKSTYDYHRDGSGICHVTMLRPSLTSMRPTHRCRLFDGPHQLSADLHLIDWLEEKRIPYDVITDHDLHREGVELLAPYRVILTGTHAEYWTREMLDGLEAYQEQGGRFIYLSGNGMYWVTALDPETQTVCEIRRTNGTRAWEAKPGEGHLSFTGEAGGIWAWRGRAPQRVTGVGFTAEGFDRGAPYRRTQASYDPRCAFLFEGIESELIGDTPSLLMNHGAAGYEVDRADVELGTPPHALIVATSTRLSDSYQYSVEHIGLMMPNQGGLMSPNVRADMVFYETPAGGAVFSVGSIAFCASLSFNGYRNDVSRLLENAVRAFSGSDRSGFGRPGGA